MTLRILIVEDSPNDRELLKYALADKFGEEAKFREASTLEVANMYLAQGNIDCVLLDLHLPDSVGKETFEKIYSCYPTIPILVMTHNKDRNLALSMIRSGAADYILKTYTNEEELYRRVLFAIEKHKVSIRVPDLNTANTIQKMDQLCADMSRAPEKEAQDIAIKTTTVIALMTKTLFTEVQKLIASLDEIRARQQGIRDKLYEVHEIVIEGGPTSLSIKSEINLLKDRLNEAEVDIRDLKRPGKN